MKKSPPPASRATPRAIGPAVVCDLAPIWEPPLPTPGPVGMKPTAINQRPRAIMRVAMMAKVRRMLQSSPAGQS